MEEFVRTTITDLLKYFRRKGISFEVLQTSQFWKPTQTLRVYAKVGDLVRDVYEVAEMIRKNEMVVWESDEPGTRVTFIKYTGEISGAYYESEKDICDSVDSDYDSITSEFTRDEICDPDLLDHYDSVAEREEENDEQSLDSDELYWENQERLRKSKDSVYYADCFWQGKFRGL